MTERDPAHDELVSAHLDGEATADEAARVEGDPALRARLETFTAVRDAVRAPVPALGDAERDALLARVAAAATAPSPVVSLESRRRPSRVIAVAAAVIAIVFLGGALGMLARDGDGGDGDSAATGASATSLFPQSALAGGSDSAAETARRDTALGSFPDTAALVDWLRTMPAADAGSASTYSQSTATTSAGPPEPTSGCVTSVAPGATRYDADVAGRAVLAVVDATTIRVLDAATCAVLATEAR
jgi:hypothetical protein